MTQATGYDSGVDWNATIPTYPVYELMDLAAKNHADSLAMDFIGKRFTWTQLAEATNRVAAFLQQSGIEKGERIGIMLPNTPFYLIFYYGIMKAGGVVVNINPLYAPAELAMIAKDSDISALVTLDLKTLFDKAFAIKQQGLVEHLIVCRFTDILPFPKNLLFPVFKFKDIAANAHAGDHISLDDVLGCDHKWQDPLINPAQDVALLQYTGGTTGTPKAVTLTHANVTANVEQCVAWFPDAKAGQEIMLGVIPFFHVFAMTAVMNLSTRLGFKIVATPRFDPLLTMKLIQRHQATFFPAVPAIYNGLLNHPKVKQFNLRYLRYCLSGGAPLPVTVKQRFEMATHATVVEGYGLSETSPVVCVNPLKNLNKPGSIGLPLPQTKIKIIALSDGSDVTDGSAGELCVQGPQVMQGYWNRPDETAAVLKDGWLRTGDVAQIDNDGYVFIVDRIKDMIITNGYKIYPRHVEEALYKHPSIEECIVAGLPDAERGEIAKVWIKCKSGQNVTEEELRVFLKPFLSTIEIPKFFEFRTEPLPKTLIGKLSRKDILAEERAKN